MKNAAKKAVNSTKKFIEDHKVGIAVTLTSIAWMKLNRYALSQHDEFLKEHELYDEFYYPTDEEGELL